MKAIEILNFIIEYSIDGESLNKVNISERCRFNSEFA